MKKEVKKALDEWAKNNYDSIWGKYDDGIYSCKIKQLGIEAVEDLAQFIWDTAYEKGFEIGHKEGVKTQVVGKQWKTLDGKIEKQASTQTATDIFNDLDVQGIYDDYRTKADRFVITTERYAKLKKKYLK